MFKKIKKNPTINLNEELDTIVNKTIETNDF